MEIENKIKDNYLFSADVDAVTQPERFTVDISFYFDDLNAATPAYKVNSFDDLIYFFENMDKF